MSHVRFVNTVEDALQETVETKQTMNYDGTVKYTKIDRVVKDAPQYQEGMNIKTRARAMDLETFKGLPWRLDDKGSCNFPLTITGPLCFGCDGPFQEQKYALSWGKAWIWGGRTWYFCTPECRDSNKHRCEPPNE